MANTINYGSTPIAWPHPVKYDVENRIETDVLVIGGGMAGAMAGVKAARRGLRAAVIDKAPVAISGAGGAGLDHYCVCISNPDCAYNPEEYMEIPPRPSINGVVEYPDHRTYIQIKGSWENLLDMEEFGMKFRDEEDEFAGAPFRDDKTKIMYAYDYKTKHTIRIRSGADIKQYMKDGLDREKNAAVFERIMITNLLTEDGKQGSRVVGATGLNTETGEFYVFSAKSIIISTGYNAAQAWQFNSEMFANGFRVDPNCSGDGVAMAWKAGAEVYSEEKFGHSMTSSPFGWPWYGIGNPDNTWFPCNLVDNKGREIPWVDTKGNPITEVDQRTRPADGQPYTMYGGNATTVIDPEKIKSGEIELPLWADLTTLPESERRAIWGLMVGNEGRTRTAIYEYFNKEGFNPEKDMLQVPAMPPEIFANHRKDWFHSYPNNSRLWKADTLKGVVVDWNQMTNVDGLFIAGATSGQGGAAAGSSGAYAANRAAEFAMKAGQGRISEAQVNAEKERVYAPVKRMEDPKANVSWKELWLGMNRVMQQDCGEFRTRVLCEHGLMWLDSIKRSEMQLTYARNPHELVRVLECENRITIAEIYLYLGIANCNAEDEGVSPDKIMHNKFVDGKFVTTYMEQQWWLKPPYAPTFLENYNKCRALETGG